MSKRQEETIATRTRIEKTQFGEYSSPIYMNSGFEFENAEDARARFAGEKDDNIYTRYSNPSTNEFVLKMCALEGAEEGLAAASGMAAVFGALAGLLNAGDHFIASRSLFGSTHSLFTKILTRWNIAHTLVDPSKPEEWHRVVQKKTKLLFLETPANPALDILDLEKAAAFCKKESIWFVVDNSFATSVIQKPMEWGADLVLHSATKYIDGQGRAIGGAILGRSHLIEEIRFFVRQTGPALSPFNAWILSKSLETLPLRMEKHSQNALEIAKRLEAHPKVNWVRYPFLKSHPAYEVAKKQMTLGGGMVSFEVKGGIEKGRQFLDSLNLFSLVANLGDTRSIATHPASTTHSKLTPEERTRVGISDGLVRLSIGLEGVEDQWKDLTAALD